MSLYGTMRTGVSGMNAQANRLSTVGDNIANASTAGYKKASTQFSSLILPSSEGAYNSGGVTTNVRYSISSQGTFTYTTSSTDLAINGRGFFIVQGSDGIEYLTRAGNFTGMSDGTLQNAAGFTLMGYQYSTTEDPTIVVNGFDGLTEINLSSASLDATASQKGVLDVNLPANAMAGFSTSTSLVAYDSQGNTRLLDYVYTKLADNSWQLDVLYKGASIMSEYHEPTSKVDVGGNLDATAAVGDVVTESYDVVDNTGTAQTFDASYTRTATGWDIEFSSGGTVFATRSVDDSEFDAAGNYVGQAVEVIDPIDTGTWSTGTITITFSDLKLKAGATTVVPVANGMPTTTVGAPITLTFDSNGKLVSPQTVVTTGQAISGAGLEPLTINIGGSTQLASDFKVGNGKIDGNSVSDVVGHEISEDGIVYLKYSNGKLEPKYRIAMADVQSPDQLKPLAGNVYTQSNDSGVIVMGYAGNGSYGTILSGALEDSNVDIAEELTSMIESQRNYTANSKVFQTGSELMEVLVNLKR